MCLISSAVHRMIGKCQNSLCRSMTRCEKKFFGDIFHRMITQQTCSIKGLALDHENTPHGIWKKCTRFLSRFSPLLGSSRLTRFLFGFLKSCIHKDTIICVDGVDIAKPKSKKMEGLRGIYDSSLKRHSTGFMYQCCSVLWIPVYMGEEGVKDDTKESMKDDDVPSARYLCFEQLVRVVSPHLKVWKEYRGIWCLDRLYDDEKVFDLMNERNLTFICRSKINRKVFVEKEVFHKAWPHGVVRIPTKIVTLTPGVYTIFLNEDSPSSLTCFVHQDAKYEKPLILLTNKRKGGTLQSSQNEERVSQAFHNLLRQYLARWDIEHLFKISKSTYDLEKIRCMKQDRRNGLLVFLQLTLAINSIVFHHLQGDIHVSSLTKVLEQSSANLRSFLSMYRTRFDAYIKSQGKRTRNRNAQCGFLAAALRKHIRSNNTKNKQQIQNAKKPPNYAQQCMFAGDGL